MKITAPVLVVVGLVVGLVVVRRLVPKVAAAVNPLSRENVFYQATGEWGTHIPDLFGGLFKSSAERQVDAMLSIPPYTKSGGLVVPVGGVVTDGSYSPPPTGIFGGAAPVVKNGTLSSGSYRDLIR